VNRLESVGDLRDVAPQHALGYGHPLSTPAHAEGRCIRIEVLVVHGRRVGVEVVHQNESCGVSVNTRLCCTTKTSFAVAVRPAGQVGFG
jgi:hypothetical protein